MLKEVGASGQISLGKRFAGQLFEMVVHADQRVELIPMSVVAGKRASAPARSRADWRPPGGYLQANDWALANREALEAYAAEVDGHGTAAEQLQQYLDAAARAVG